MRTKCNPKKGDVFGRWTLVSYSHKNKWGAFYWTCRCECGLLKTKAMTDLRAGRSRSCGCVRDPDKTGWKIGRLSIIKRGQLDKRGQNTWVCLCECGNTVEIRSARLNKEPKNGTKSCDKCKGTRYPRMDKKDRHKYLNRISHLNTKFSLSESEYISLVDKTKGVCVICGGSLCEPAVDHDHSTGKIRGVICNKCNRGIGLLGDSYDTLSAATKYLKEYP